MNRNRLFCFMTAFLVLHLATSCSRSQSAGKGPVQTTDLWPEIQPYRTGHLRVSDLHELFYQLGEKPQGKPVMVLHGGPGAGCTPYTIRYFNPEKFHIVLHDQRGAGHSKPYAEIKDNTTQALVDDIEKLRKHLGLDKVLLFGESWRSTLALALLENHYIANACFLKEGELLNRAGRLAGIPVTIVNGRYDVICPPITAYRLHQKLTRSKLIIVEGAGHSADEPGIEKALVQAVREFE